MKRRLFLAAAPFALLLSSPRPARSEEVVRKVGRVVIRAELAQAFPGGVIVVRLGGTRLGGAWALLEGWRAPFYPDRGGPRALVPVPVSAEPGAATLGIELASRHGEQRLVVPVQIAARSYPQRDVLLGPTAADLLARAEVAHDARRLLGYLRTESKTPAPGPLAAPVAGEGDGFGELRASALAQEVESRVDALSGERHRGLDYGLPAGTPVRAPGAGAVLFAGALALAGETVVIDHGQGVVSVLHHLSRLDVRAGDAVGSGQPVGLSGDTGLAAAPLLQWRVYLHGVAVDPRALVAVLG
ncbi:MAG TPA: M23 family metallopeptidase [Vicinamibacteria bacterium]|nr:M23 family metallopeptidase [Vicinamibacteria bacterium]